MKKRFLSMLLAAAMVVTTLVSPLVASAAANVNTSVDGRRDTATQYVATVSPKKEEITVGLGGNYKLKLTEIGLSKDAMKHGLFVVNDTTIGYLAVVNNEVVTIEIPVTWEAALPKYASVTKTGTLSANKVCKKNLNGTYKTAKLNAVVANKEYPSSDIWTKFDGGIIAQVAVTVVPEIDLSAYFLGVWTEDKADRDAQHYFDYAVTEGNVKPTLKQMAEDLTAHCVGEGFKVVAFTKTNDGTVRAYVQTTNAKAGNHYYVLAYTSVAGYDRIVVTERDYCATKYVKSGSLIR